MSIKLKHLTMQLCGAWAACEVKKCGFIRVCHGCVTVLT